MLESAELNEVKQASFFGGSCKCLICHRVLGRSQKEIVSSISQIYTVPYSLQDIPKH